MLAEAGVHQEQRRIALGIAYDGTAFHGWQRQRAHTTRTVQGVLEEALGAIATHPVATVCAGRTDAGVHAEGQVVHFDTHTRRPLRAWVRGGNSSLPGDLRIAWAREVPADFHARFQARARLYRYLISDRRPGPSPLLRHCVLQEWRPLDTRLMQQEAEVLCGRHDFSSFRGAACGAPLPIRTIYALRIRRHSSLIILEVLGDAFLLHMVRNIVGVLSAVGAGRQPPGWTQRVLAARDRRQGGITAPARGLCLAAVHYAPHWRLPVPDGGMGQGQPAPLPRPEPAAAFLLESEHNEP